MKDRAIYEALKLAEMFANRAELTLAERKKHGKDFIGTKNSGALRRMSMELTRALATMRNPK